MEELDVSRKQYMILTNSQLTRPSLTRSQLSHPQKSWWRYLVTALGLALTFTLYACSGNTGPTTSQASTPGADGSVPTRVVALDWRYEEMLNILGVRPVGIVEIGDSKEPATLKGQLDGITSVGQAKQPNLEVIQSLKPDLILASPTRQGAIMDQLSEIAPTESYSDATYTDVLDSMDKVAEKLGKTAEAKKFRDGLDEKIQQAKAAVKPGTRVAMAGWSKDTLTTWLGSSFPASLLKDVGYEYGFEGEKTAVESKTDVAQMTGDKLADMNLDILFLYNDTEAFHSSPFAKLVPTVEDVEQDTWSRARGPLAAQAMVEQVITLSEKQTPPQ